MPCNDRGEQQGRPHYARDGRNAPAKEHAPGMDNLY